MTIPHGCILNLFWKQHQHRNREIIWPVANKKIQTKNTNSISEQQFDRNFSKWSSSECLSIPVKKKLKSALFISLN